MLKFYMWIESRLVCPLVPFGRCLSNVEDHTGIYLNGYLLSVNIHSRLIPRKKSK